MKGLRAISVIVATYNDEDTIAHFLRELVGLSAEEIIAVDGNSTGRTAEIARRYAKVLIQPPCRVLQMNAGARAAWGEVLLFLHADVHLPPGALAAIQRAMRNPYVLGGDLDIRYEGSDLIKNLRFRILATTSIQPTALLSR